MFYIFHGENEYSRAEELARLRGKLAGGDPAMAELNTVILDGRKLAWGELRHACDSMPFMADRRLVIVHGLLSRLTARRKAKDGEVEEGAAWKRKYLEDLAAYLPIMPETTRLIFVEARTLPASHPILKAAKAGAKHGQGFVKLYKQPKEWQIPNWIRQRAKEKGGKISSQAVALLAALVGNDLRQLDQELEKLHLYADGEQVTTEHVQALVSRARQTSIFDLVDCVGRRQTDQALKLLHRLLDDGEAPLYLLAMLARQIRILIQVSELREQGLSQKDMASRLKLHPYVVEKGLAQASNFRMDQLEAAHQRLLYTDWSIKTGQSEDVLALDTLVVALASL